MELEGAVREQVVQAPLPEWFLPAVFVLVLFCWLGILPLWLWLERWRKGVVRVDARDLSWDMGDQSGSRRLLDIESASVSSFGGTVTIDLDLREGFDVIGPVVAGQAEERAIRAFFAEVQERLDALDDRRGRRQDVPEALKELR